MYDKQFWYCVGSPLALQYNIWVLGESQLSERCFWNLMANRLRQCAELLTFIMVIHIVQQRVIQNTWDLLIYFNPFFIICLRASKWPNCKESSVEKMTAVKESLNLHYESELNDYWVLREKQTTKLNIYEWMNEVACVIIISAQCEHFVCILGYFQEI